MHVSVNGRTRHYRTVTFDAARNAVQLVEQRLLPHRFQIVATADYRETARAIKDMMVRGAPAIAATAAYGLAQGARAFRGGNLAAFRRHLDAVYAALKAARPTAVEWTLTAKGGWTRHAWGQTSLWPGRPPGRWP